MTEQREAATSDNPGRHRYEARIGDQLVGVLDYRQADDVTVFTHAEVYPRWEGQGVATAMTRAALDDVISKGHAVEPLCPFVVDFVDRNPAYQHHVRAHH